MLVSGNWELHPNSDRHLTQSCKYGDKTDQFVTIVSDAMAEAEVNAS